MMLYFNGLITYTSPGTKSEIYVGFTPKKVRITAFQKYNGSTPVTQNFAHSSDGSGTPNLQLVNSTIESGRTLTQVGKIVSVLEKDAVGNVIEVAAAKIDSFTATGIRLEVMTANAGYKYYIEVEG